MTSLLAASVDASELTPPASSEIGAQPIVEPSDPPQPPATAANVARWTRTRNHFGLAGDEATVRRLYDKYGTSTALGTPLSPSELSRIEARQRLAASAPAVRRALKAVELGQADMYLEDDSSGFKLVVQATTTLPEAAKEQVRSASVDPSRVDFRVVENSEDELVTAMDEVRLETPETQELGIHSTAIDVKANRVILFTETSDAAARSSSVEASRFSDSIYVHRTAPLPIAQDSAGYSPGQMKSGLSIYNEAEGATCTSGFPARQTTSPYKYGVLTAGHCDNSESATWVHGAVGNDFTFGRTDGNSYDNNSSADSLFISFAGYNEALRSNLQWVGNNRIRQTGAVQNELDDVINDIVCMYGQTTLQLDCGPLLIKNFDTPIYDEGLTVRFIQELRVADYMDDEGDSGAAVMGGYKGAVAYGIHTGHFPGLGALYSHIDNVQQELNVEVTTALQPISFIPEHATSKCVDVHNGNDVLIQWSCHGGLKQQWVLKPVFETIYYELRSKYGSEPCAIASGGGKRTTAPYTPVVGSTCNLAQSYRQWDVADNGDDPDDIGFLARHTAGDATKLCADVLGTDTSEGADLGLYPCVGNASQRYKMKVP